MKESYLAYGCFMALIYCAGSGTGTFRENLPARLTVLAFFAALVRTAVEDMKCMEIADRNHLHFLILAGISCVTMPEIGVLSRAAGMLCVSVPFLLFALAFPGSFGGGDIKLAAVCGAFLGWKRMAASALIGILLAGLWGGCQLAAGKKGRRDPFPLVPFLGLGMAVGIFAGEMLMGWL